MRRVLLPDGRRVRAYSPDELGASPSGSGGYSRRSRAELLVSRLFGSHDQPGPLMIACKRDAEHVPHGGHRHILHMQPDATDTL